MAKRRSWSTGKRIAYGLGQAGNDIFAQLMRDQMADKANERVQRRQMLADERTMSRQFELQKRGQQFQARQDTLNDLPKLIEEQGPEAAFARLAQNQSPSSFEGDYVGTGEPQMEALGNLQADSDLVDAMRKPLRRRLEGTVGKRIGDVTDPAMMPSASDIEQQSVAEDERSYTPHIQIGPGDQQGEVMGLAPEVQDLIDRAAGKRSALEGAQGQMVEYTNPDGSKGTRWAPRSELRQGVTTAPDAMTQGQNAGTIAGQTELGKLQTAGPAMAKQAGSEAYARENAGIQAKLNNAKALIDFDTAQALAKLQTLGPEVDARAYANSVADARDAAAKSMPVITQIQSLYIKARPLIAKMNYLPNGMGGGLEAQMREDYQPKGTMPAPVKQYLDAVDMARPLLARAFGQTGNPALMEQEWAKYVPNFSDSEQDGLLKLARLEALSSSGVQMAALTRERGAALTGGDVDAILAPKIQQVYQSLLQMRDEQQRGASGVAPGTLPNLQGIGLQVGPNGRLRLGGGQ